jgi:hypothetical protein
MNYAIEGIYKNGKVELVETPVFHKPVEVLVVFLENKRKIIKLGGLFSDFTVDYEGLGQDLKELSRNSSAHILDESESGI